MRRWMVVLLVVQIALTSVLLLAYRAMISRDGLLAQAQRMAPHTYSFFPAFCLAIVVAVGMTFGVWWTFGGPLCRLMGWSYNDSQHPERWAFFLAWTTTMPPALHAYSLAWFPRHTIVSPILLALVLLTVGYSLQRRRSRRSRLHTMPVSS